jgi:hypothetical protein
MMHASRGAPGRRAALVGLLVSVSLVSLGIAPVPARADEGDAATPPRMDNRARAQQLFDSALADAEAGNLASACPKFLASQEADPKTSTLLNLASCYEKNGQTASAWGAFREAEGLARKVARADWESAARSHAEALEPKLVRLTIQVPEPSRVAGLVVMRDGAKIPAGEWGVAIPVDPGEHLVTAMAMGRAPWETRIPVREASSTIAIPVLDILPPEMTPPPAPAASAPGAETRARPTSWWTPLRTAGVVVAGAGVVGLVAGGVLGLVAKSKYDKARALCTDGARGCPAGAVSDSDSAYGMATGGTVVFVVGAAAALGGAALVLFSPAPDATTGSTVPKNANGASAALHFGPGTIELDGRW